MTYLKRLQERCRSVTPEYVPAVRALGQLSEIEVGNQEFAKNYLEEIGLPDMAIMVKSMADHEYHEFIENLEDTTDEEMH